MAPFDQNRDPVRHSARVQAFKLIYEIQAGTEGALDDLNALALDATQRGWSEVSRVALFGTAVDRWLRRDADVAGAVANLIESSENDGDDAMLALGLALSSDAAFSGDSATSEGVNLARAVVLLEQADGSELERITAHTACGIAFANRSMFELAEEQYRAAISIGEKEPPHTVDFLLAPIMFNLAELDVQWASLLRQLNDTKGVGQRWNTWTVVTDATTAYEIPPAWKTELDALGVLLFAIAGFDAAATAERMLKETNPTSPSDVRTIGLLRLAIAIGKSTADDATAMEAAELAVESIDPDTHPQIHDLALSIAAENEAKRGGTAGIRFARRHLAQRWSSRLESLASMESSIHAERLASEREMLTAHALRDDLTGIGNRRALDRYLDELAEHDVQIVALIIFDIDGFKSVNDGHGHLAGDAVLVTIAQLLSRGVRSSDLAVRLGGDEFAVVLARIDLEAALERAKSLLRSVDRQNFGTESDPLIVTLSAGVAAGDPTHLPELWAEADAAMYRAKSGAGIALDRSRVALPRVE